MRKRRHKRIIKRLETDFSADGLAFRGISSDLSRSGLFVRTNKPFSPGTLVDLTIHLPGNMVSRLKGCVRRAIKTGQTTIKNGMGLEIVERDQNYINFLNGILPIEDQEHHIEYKNSGAVPSVANSEPMARPTVEQDSKDDEIDSMISSLFSKRDNKEM